MALDAKYAHTNLIALDWRRLADFYVRVLGCELLEPERDLKGPVMEAGTGVAGVHVRGAHLRLPGYGENGPTLELFNYNLLEPRFRTAINRPGFAHIAFAVPDVAAARDLILQSGGLPVGDLVTTSIASGARITWCYVTDPEGNILELQSWSAGD